MAEQERTSTQTPPREKRVLEENGEEFVKSYVQRGG